MQEVTAATAPNRHGVPQGYDGPHACGTFELAGVVDLANLVLRTLGTPAGQPPRHPSIGFDYPHIYNPANMANVRLVARAGRVVSSVGIYPTRVRTSRGEISVGGINAFVTHPDHRRRGLGAAVLEDAHRQMQANGHHIGLLGTGIQDYYRKYGWELAGRGRTFVFDRGNIGFLPVQPQIDVTEEWHPHIKALAALHNAEALGARRSVENFQLLAERRFRRVFISTQGGKPIAYAAVGGTAVREYGGEPSDVARLLHHVFTELDDPSIATSERPPGKRATIEMSVLTPDARSGLPAYLAQCGIEPAALNYLGMIVILDAPGLFEALAIGNVQLQRNDPRWHLQHNNKSLDVDDRGLVKLVFGPETYPEFAPDLFPIDFYQWPADKV